MREILFTEGHVSGGITVQVSREVREGTQRALTADSTENTDHQNSSSDLSVSSAVKNNLRESASSVDTSVVVSDFLGTTLGTVSGEQFAPVHLTAFGEVLTADNTNHTEGSGSVRVPRAHEGVTPEGSAKGVASGLLL